jgi:hypothetical protein
MKFILLSVFSILLIAKSQSVNPYFENCCAPDGTQCYDGTSSIDSNTSDPDFCDRACYRLECNYNWDGKGDSAECQACHDSCGQYENIKYNEQCCAPDGTQCFNGLDPNDSDESNPGYCDRMCYRIDCNYNWDGQGDSAECQACHDACHAKRR